MVRGVQSVNSKGKDEGTEIEQLLLRSARSDRPHPDARVKTWSAVLAELERAPARANWRLKLSFAIAAGILGILCFRIWTRPVALELRAEAPRPGTGPASSGTARAAPVASGSLESSKARPACPKLSVASGTAPRIDDFEDRNARLLVADGRSGFWAVYNDGTGKQTPAASFALHPARLPKPRDTSRYALHTSGTTFTRWGSVIVGLFTDGAGCYDVSAYSGLEFWAKGNTRIYVSVPITDEIAVANGGLCQDAAGCPSGPRRAFDLGPAWQKFVISFRDLEKSAEPTRMPFDPRRVVSVNLSVHREDTPFDIWIDDVSFIENE
jgi:hypothetical protein